MAKKKINPKAQAIISAVDGGLYATTVKLAEEFLADNPESPRALIDLGQALSQMARYQEAQDAFQKVIDLEEGTPAPILGEIGNLYRAQGDFAAAIDWYQKQVDAAPDEALGYLYMGNVILRQGKFTEALAQFEKALQCKDVCLEEVHYSIGLTQRAMADYSLAKEHFEKALMYRADFADAKVALKDVKSLI